ncbi:MAG: YihY family inner membrane protein [Pseudomonadales bacterium]|nr:YihY family inner membrane protein [Pseudomonadales bacterium]
MALQFDRIQSSIDEQRKQAQFWLWQSELSDASLPKRFLIKFCQIFIAVMRDLVQGQLSLRAMSLVFTTVIGIFPLLAITFAVLKSLGVHNRMEPTLLTLLQPLGERANELTADVLTYVDNLQLELIGITSVGLLIYLALDMMRKIESSFNYIWAVKHGRSWSSRVSEYLFAVIVSPLLLFLSIGITSTVNTNFFERFLQDLIYGGLVLELLALIAPILLMSLAFAFAYGFLPNTKVQFSSAFIGGFVTTIIWKLMGSVFQGFFVAASRENIYLAFATAIAIMFFIYIGWLVALIGSSIAFYHQNPGKSRTGREQIALSISQQEQLSLAIATSIIRRFSEGQEPLSEDQLAASLRCSGLAIENAIENLQKINLITATNDNPPRYLPTHSVTDCTIVEIWQAIRNLNTDEISQLTNSSDLELIQNFQSELESVVSRELGTKKFI